MRVNKNSGYLVPAGFTFFLVMLFSLSSLADFRLPILFPVEKEVMVDEGASEDLLSRLTKIDGLSLEVQMSEGNMMRDILLERLNRLLKGVKKKIVLSGKVKRVHVEQLKKLDRFEVAWHSNGQKMDNETFTSLYELGPVRKYIEFPQGMKTNDLVLLKHMKFYTPVIVLGNKPVGKTLVDWLVNTNHKRVRFVLSAGFPTDKLYDLCRFKSISIEVETQNNTVPTNLLNVLKDLRGVEIEFVVDGRLTLENVQAMTILDRFSLKIQLDNPPDYTPGLINMLNEIAPPSVLRSKP